MEVYSDQTTVPNVAAATAVPVQVIADCGGANTLSNIEPATIAETAPEFFSHRPGADGRSPVAAINASTGAALGSAELGADYSPAKPGDTVSVFGTSFGSTQPAVAPGDVPADRAALAAQVSVTLGGKELAAENILYAGVTPGRPGYYQLDLLLPADTPDGDLPIVVTIGGISSPAGAFLTVKAPPVL